MLWEQPFYRHYTTRAPHEESLSWNVTMRLYEKVPCVKVGHSS